MRQRELVSEKAEALRHRDAVNRVNLAAREYLDDNVALADSLLDEVPEDLKAWEWEYARRMGHSELKTFSGSSIGQDVWSVAFSPDGSLIASGSGPWGYVGGDPTGELIVRSTGTGQEVFTQRRLTGAVQAVAFSPTGRELAAAWGFTSNPQGANLAVFEIPSGRKLWQKSERGFQILSMVYAPDGRSIASGCGHFTEHSTIGYARLRDSATGEPIGQTIPGGPGGVFCVSFSPDGHQLALASSGVADICDLSSPKRRIVHHLRGHVNFIYAVAFSPDGKSVATAGWDKTIRLWDRATGALLQTLTGHRGFVRCLAYSADSTQLVSGSEDKSVRRWDLFGGGENAAFHGHTAFVHCVAFGPDGSSAASGSQDGTVKLWPVAAPDTQVTFRNSTGWVGAVALAPDGRRAASAHNGNVRVWDPRTGEEFQRLPAPQGMLGRLALVFSPDGTTLAISGRGTSVNLWNTTTWKTEQTLTGLPSSPTDADYSIDGKLLITSCGDGTLRLWNVADGEPRWTIQGHEKAANAVVFSPDGRRVASCGEDKQAKVWDALSGSELAAFSGHTTGVRDLAFSPDGRTIASVAGAYRGPNAAEVKLWDSMTGQPLTTYQGHTSLVTAVAYFPGGRRLATASDDRTIKLWDTRTGENVFTLRGHTSGVVSLAVSRDGQQLVSGSIDYTAKAWSIANPEPDIAAELSLRRAAVERVQALISRRMLKAQVIEVIKSNKYLSPRLRAAALEVAERRTENATGLYQAGWLTVLRPGGKTEDYKTAERQLAAACKVVVDDYSRLAQYTRALALAKYRAGRPAEAIETLKALEQRARSAEPGAGSNSASSSAAKSPENREATPVELAVMAMASQQLGDTKQAQTALDQFRKLSQTARWSNDQEAQVLLQDTESVVNSPTHGELHK